MSTDYDELSRAESPAIEYVETPSHAVILDVDGTVTRKHEALFAIVSRGLPQKSLEKLRQMHLQYGSGAKDGSLTKDEERTWLYDSMQVFIDAGLTVQAVKAALAGFTFRPGFRECLEWLRYKNIPTGFDSYGIRSFIKIAMEAAGISYGELIWTIYAARFDIDLKSGRYVGIDPASFVLPSDKGRWSENFADWMRVPHSRILAVGDSGGDRLLGHLKENRLGLAHDEAEAAIIAPHFGHVIVTDTFYPAFDWLRSKIESRLP